MEAETDITTPNSPSVYRYYDSLGILIYVGITSQRSARNRQHNQDKEWWPLVARQDVEHFETREQIVAREAELIRKHSPPFNIQKNVDWASARAVYLQLRATGFEQLDPVRLLHTYNRRIPLDFDYRGNGHTPLRFKTRLEHAVIVMRLRNVPERRIMMNQSTTVGLVQSIEHVGPVAIIHPVYYSARFQFVRAHAVIKQVAEKGPVVFEIRSINLFTEEEQ